MSLYKYLKADRIDILKNKNIRFTPQSGLNDAFEMRPYFETYVDEEDLKVQLKQRFYARDPNSDMVEDRSSVTFSEISAALVNGRVSFAEYSKTVIPYLREQITPLSKKEYYDNIDSTYGVLCLTERPDNLLMWGHYADGHRGFAIEFDEKHPFFHHELKMMPGCGLLLKVKYSKDRPNFKKFTQITFVEMLFTKSEDWIYEQEWRIVNLLGQAECIEDYPEYGKLHLFNFPAGCIKGIIFGCRMSSEKRDCIINYIKNDPDYNHINLKNAVINERTYNLDLRPI